MRSEVKFAQQMERGKIVGAPLLHPKRICLMVMVFEAMNLAILALHAAQGTVETTMARMLSGLWLGYFSSAAASVSGSAWSCVVSRLPSFTTAPVAGPKRPRRSTSRLLVVVAAPLALLRSIKTRQTTASKLFFFPPPPLRSSPPAELTRLRSVSI